MRVELFPFQKRALADIRMKTAEAMGSYHRTHAPQVVSFTAPTGAGKTIIMSALIEAILFGDEQYMEQQDAIIVWLSDSPQLNEQSKQKIDSKADKIKLSQCVTVSEESFDKEVFEDGHVYFLNTQKLSVTSKLTKNGDGRTYTIWQTLANTVREKSDRLYFIIDEAHRGYILDKEMGDTEILYRDQRDYQSKYRSVIEYFDAVKIALTATPALQTTEIFGQPVFKYTYREAVIEGYLVDHDAPHHLETKLSTGGIHYKSGDTVMIYDPVTAICLKLYHTH